MGGSAKYRFFKRRRNNGMSDDFIQIQWEMSKEYANDIYRKNLSLEKLNKLSGEKQADLLNKLSMIDIEYLPENLQIGSDDNEFGDFTQKLAYFLHINEKPTVLGEDGFTEYMQNNNISQSDLITRAVTTGDTLQSWMDDEENYISGRIGEHFFGYGSYFAHNNGKPLGGYGNSFMNAIVSPDAKVLDLNKLGELKRAIEKLPKEVQNIIPDGEDGVSAIAMLAGYDAIQTYPDKYIVVINRGAIITDGVIRTRE